MINKYLLVLCLFFSTDIFAQTFGVNLAGAEFDYNNIPGTYNQHYAYPTVASLDYYNSKGLKFIRLPFLWERMQPVLDGPLNAEELARMDIFVAGAKARGMRVILDVHNYARYKKSGTVYIIGSPQVTIANFRNFWKLMSDHYKEETAIYAYGLMNEPHTMGSYSWFNAAQQAIYGIREVDKVHYIFVPGNEYSSAQRWPDVSDNLKNIVDSENKIVYEAHQYFDFDASGRYKASYDDEGTYPNVGVDRVKSFRNWLVTNNKRGFVGEFGVPGNDVRWNAVLENFLKFLSDNCIYGAYWAGGPRWGNYALSIEPSGTTEKPQMAVVQKYTSFPSTCSNILSVDDPLSLDISLTPNPAINFFHIQAENLKSDLVIIRIMDMQGKLVKEIKDYKVPKAYSRSVSIEDLAPGVYFVHLINNNKYSLSKLIKL